MDIIKKHLIDEKKVLLAILVLEVFISGLFLINHYLILIFPAIIICIFLIYYGFFTGPKYWIYLMVFSTGLDMYGRVIGGITLFHVSYFFSIFTLILYYLTNRQHFDFYTPMNKYVLLYLIISSISLIYTPNLLSGAELIIIVASLFFLFLLIINFVKTTREHLWLLWSLLLANILNSLVIFYQIAFQNITYIGRGAVQSVTGEKIWRAAGLFYDPNVGATYIMIGTIIGLAVLLYSNIKRVHKILIFISVVVSSLGILATFSRSGWVGLIIGFFVVALFHRKKIYLLYTLGVLIIFLLVLIVFTEYGGFILNRAMSIFEIMTDLSIRTRIGLAISGIKMFIDHPFFGIGLRGFPVLYDFYLSPVTPQQLLYVKESHTLYVDVLAELGIMGIFIIILWFKRVLMDTYRKINSIENPTFRSILIGNFGVLVSLVIVYAFYGNLFPDFNLIWVNFGVIYSILKYNENNETI